MRNGIVEDGAERLRGALMSELSAPYASCLAAAGPRRRRKIEKVLRRKVAREWQRLAINSRTLW